MMVVKVWMECKKSAKAPGWEGGRDWEKHIRVKEGSYTMKKQKNKLKAWKEMSKNK